MARYILARDVADLQGVLSRFDDLIKACWIQDIQLKRIQADNIEVFSASPDLCRIGFAHHTFSAAQKRIKD